MTQEVLSTLLDCPGVPKILYGNDIKKSFSIVKNKFKNLHCETKKADCSCEQCMLTSHPNFYFIEPVEDPKSKAKIKSKHIKTEDLREFVSLRTPLFGGQIFNVVVGIDWCTPDTVAILLKTIEDCRDSAQWFLIASDISNVSGAIRSRCIEIFVHGTNEALHSSISSVFDLKSSDALSLLENLCKVYPPTVVIAMLVRTHPYRVTESLSSIIGSNMLVYTNLVKIVYITMAEYK